MKNIFTALALAALATVTAAAATSGPNDNLTPGAIVTRDPNVTCATGYSRRTRMDRRTSTWRGIVRDVLAKYGIDRSERYDYEIDHRIPIALGGAPADERNIWPESWPDAHDKDRYEFAAYDAVCFKHSMTLEQAQYGFAHDWHALFPHGLPPMHDRYSSNE